MSDQILSQEEINALLAAFDEEQQANQQTQKAKKRSDKAAVSVKKYDFLRPDKFSKDQLRTLEMMHESFARTLQTSLSGLLRTSAQIEVLSVTEMMYEEFIQELSMPSILNVISLQALNSKIAFEINPHLGFVMLDRLLGGPGAMPRSTRAITEIEQTLIRRIVDHMIAALRKAWEPVLHIDPIFEDTEINPQFVQIVAPQDMTVMISFRVRIEDIVGRMNLCLPYVCLEPVAPKLKAQVWFASSYHVEPGNSHDIIQKQLEDMNLPLAVELGSGTISVGDFINLQEGDVIQLNKRTDESLVIRVGDRRRFYGRPGQVGNRLAIEVLDALREGERDE